MVKRGKKLEKRGRPSNMDAASREQQKEFEERLATAATAYRDRHFAGASAGRVRWNQEGADKVIGIAKSAAREFPDLNKKALAEAAHVAYGTMLKWLDSAADVKPPRRTATTPAAPKSTMPSKAGGHVTFDIVKLVTGGFRVSIDPKDIKTFLQSI